MDAETTRLALDRRNAWLFTEDELAEVRRGETKPMFLTAEELVDLTGWKRASRQVAWLRKNGVKHYVRRDGRPCVPLDALAQPATADPVRARPDFSNVRAGA